MPTSPQPTSPPPTNPPSTRPPSRGPPPAAPARAPRTRSGPLRRAERGGGLPELSGVLTGEEVRRTVSWIAGEQDRDGALPWFRGGQLDAWDSVEAAMALDVGGEHARAAAAYRWLV